MLVKKCAGLTGQYLLAAMFLAMAAGLCIEEKPAGVLIIGGRLFGFDGGGYLLLAIHSAVMAIFAIAGIAILRGDGKIISGVGLLAIMVSHTSPSPRILAMPP